MQLDECVQLPADAQPRSSARWLFRCVGPNARKRAFEARRRRPRAVRHRARRRRSRLRAESLRALVEHRLRRLCHWRPRGRRGAKRDARSRRRDRPLRCPRRQPRYLMGVGTPDDLIEASRAASTCSIASCRRATAATASPLPASARSISRTRTTPTIARPLDAESPLPGRARFFPRLSASPVPECEALGGTLFSTGQSLLLPRADGGSARGHRRRPFCRLSRRDQRAMATEARRQCREIVSERTHPKTGDTRPLAAGQRD